MIFENSLENLVSKIKNTLILLRLSTCLRTIFIYSTSLLHFSYLHIWYLPVTDNHFPAGKKYWPWELSDFGVGSPVHSGNADSLDNSKKSRSRKALWHLYVRTSASLVEISLHCIYWFTCQYYTVLFILFSEHNLLCCSTGWSLQSLHAEGQPGG